MNKNNYYYKKLGQAFLFDDKNWKEIADENDPYDNVYTEQFLKSFYQLLLEYQFKKCLEEEQQKKAGAFLNEYRFSYSYQSRTEKEAIYSYINDMNRLVNTMSDKNAMRFYREEFRKRYGVYFNSVLFQNLYALFMSHCVFDGMESMKEDLANDVYSAMLLHYSVEEIGTDEHLLLDYCTLGFINAVEIEEPKLLNDIEVLNRYIALLQKNKRLLENPDYAHQEGSNDDAIFKIQNEVVLTKLKNRRTTLNK